MARTDDPLIRFLLPEARSRGAIIRAPHLLAEARRVHGLTGAPADLLGETLLASILLLSIGKGGVRQVLQIDALERNAPLAPMTRMLAETRAGAVRGYVTWREKEGVRDAGATGVGAWLGRPVRVSTVRDLGFGHPYVSTIECDSDYVADLAVAHLTRSVQTRADVVLRGDLALLIEAMPGCGEEQWFRAVELLAGIDDTTLDEAPPESILARFAPLGCREVGRDAYAYRCGCTRASVTRVLDDMPRQRLRELADARGRITLSCRYCDAAYEVDVGPE